MFDKRIKILTLVVYLGIQVGQGYFGGPMIGYLYFGLFSKLFISVLGVTLALAAIVFLVVTIFKPEISGQKVLVPFSFAILTGPIMYHILYIKRSHDLTNISSFVITCGMFVVLATWWIYLLWEDDGKRQSHH